jgi:hypothetical protein
MDATLENWKTQLGTLPPHDRAELAHFLLSSLGPGDEDAEEAWDAEASRRVAGIRAGVAKGQDADAFLAGLRERYP